MLHIEAPQGAAHRGATRRPVAFRPQATLFAESLDNQTRCGGLARRALHNPFGPHIGKGWQFHLGDPEVFRRLQARL